MIVVTFAPVTSGFVAMQFWFNFPERALNISKPRSRATYYGASCKQSVLSVPTVPTPSDSGETKWLLRSKVHGVKSCSVPRTDNRRPMTLPTCNTPSVRRNGQTNGHKPIPGNNFRQYTCYREKGCGMYFNK